MKKRKQLYCMLLCLFALTQVHAQRFKGGAHIGLLATQVDGDNHGGYKKPGLFLGVFANLPFPEKRLQLQLELNYAQKGSRVPSNVSEDGSSVSNSYKIALHQIELPLVLGWNFWKKFSLEAGASCNILASAKESVMNIGVASDEGGSRFYLFELGGIAGINYCFKEHFGLSFRMNYSLSPIGRSVELKQGRKLEKYMWNNALLFRFYYQF
jgi:hypothetical protein